MAHSIHRRVRLGLALSFLVPLASSACGDSAPTGTLSVGPVTDAGTADTFLPLDAAVPDVRDANPDVVTKDAGKDTEGADAADAGPADPCVGTLCGVSVGGLSVCALRKSGVLKCWGYGARGALGLGDGAHRGNEPNEMGQNLPAVDLGTGRKAVRLGKSGGATSMCAVLDDDTLKCWGYNLYGQLGLGDVANRGALPNEMGDALAAVDLGTGRHAKDVVIGPAHACAILDDDTLKCWGRNHLGQLGLGDTNNRGDNAGEMGDALPVVDLGTGRHAKDVVLGDDMTCVLLDDDTVKCFGGNAWGQLGQSKTTPIGTGAGQMGDALAPIALGTGRTAKSIAGGYGQVCALLDDGSVKCWGNNDQGRLGVGDTAHRGDAPGEMGDALSAVPLGTGRTALAIGASGSGACARLDDGTLKCWGYNGNGVLGQGDTMHRGDDPNELGDALAPIDFGGGRKTLAIYIGWSSHCALLNDGALVCWGGNSYGQLGLGDGNNRGDGPNEMGSALSAVDF
ncbi:MAG: hypothetical protein U0174_26330 [Polyangiaceae bacterium]